MKAYDVVVIGSGSGTYIAARALYEGLSVALIDHGPLGGTCPNTGCIPSKMLISAADRIMEIRESKTFGIYAKIENIDIPAIFERMRAERLRRGAITRNWMEENQENLDFYSATGHFIDDYTLVAGRQTLRGEKIFIAPMKPFSIWQNCRKASSSSAGGLSQRNTAIFSRRWVPR
jgi:mycothione reductase